MVYFTLEALAVPGICFSHHLKYMWFFWMVSSVTRAIVQLQIVVSLVPRKVKQLLKLYFKNGPYLPPFTNPIFLFSCIHKPSVLCCISDHLLYHFIVIMVKDLQIVQVLACDLILHVGNVCVSFLCMLLCFWEWIALASDSPWSCHVLMLRNINFITCGIVEVKILLYFVSV